MAAPGNERASRRREGPSAANPRSSHLEQQREATGSRLPLATPEAPGGYRERCLSPRPCAGLVEPKGRWDGREASDPLSGARRSSVCPTLLARHGQWFVCNTKRQARMDVNYSPSHPVHKFPTNLLRGCHVTPAPGADVIVEILYLRPQGRRSRCGLSSRRDAGSVPSPA